MNGYGSRDRESLATETDMQTNSSDRENDENPLADSVAELAHELLAERHGPGSGCTVTRCYRCEQTLLPTRVQKDQSLPNQK